MQKLTIIAALLAACPCVACAQRDSILLDSVEVRGVRHADNLTSPAPVQSLASQDMLRLGAYGVEDALRHVAGVTVKDYGGAGGMKTASVRGIGAKHTAVSYDGITLTDAQTGETDLARYSLANMESISLTMGDDDEIFQPARNAASAALLAMNTNMDLSLTASHRLRGGITIGSWGTVQPHVAWTQKVNSRMTVNVQGEYLYSENNYPFTLYNGTATSREHREHSRISSGHGEANILWTPSRRDRLTAKVYYYDCSRQLPGIVHLYTQDNNEHLTDRNAFSQATWRHTFSARLAMKTSVKFNWNKTLYDVGIPSGGVKTEHYWQREYYATTAWLYAFAPWLTADYSLDYAFSNLNSTLTTATSAVNGPIAVHPSRHSIVQQLAVKAQTGRLTATARLLYSAYIHGVKEGEKAGNAHRFTPSVMASYKLFSQPEIRVRASWKSIFRMPTFNELYYYHIGSATLTPERTSQWNVGLTAHKAFRLLDLRMTVDAYRGRVTDKIVAIPYNMFVWRTTNMASVRTHGIDATLNAEGRIAERQSWELTANYSWQRTENHTNSTSPYYGNQLAYTPEHTGAVALSWLNPWVNLTVAADGMSHRWTTNEHVDDTRLAGFAEMNITMFRTFPLRRASLTLRAAVRNVLDKQYEFIARYPMPGRSWKVSAIIEL